MVTGASRVSAANPRSTSTIGVSPAMAEGSATRGRARASAPSSASSCWVNFASAGPRRPTTWMVSIGWAASSSSTCGARSEPAISAGDLARMRATSMATLPLPTTTAERTERSGGGA